VPIVLSDVVQQAIVSAYPTARLEEVPEHNMFNETGKLSGTVGGELSLKKFICISNCNLSRKQEGWHTVNS
jgi:hypothetical protein